MVFGLQKVAHPSFGLSIYPDIKIFKGQKRSIENLNTSGYGAGATGARPRPRRGLSSRPGQRPRRGRGPNIQPGRGPAGAGAPIFSRGAAPQGPGPCTLAGARGPSGANPGPRKTFIKMKRIKKKSEREKKKKEQDHNEDRDFLEYVAF